MDKTQKIMLVITLIIIVIIAMALFSNFVKGDIVNVRTINNNNTLTIIIGNTTNTYSTLNNFDNTVSIDISGTGQCEEVVLANESIIRSVLDNELALKFKDQQAYFEQTVLPSQSSLTSNQSAFFNCQANLNNLQLKNDFFNQTHIPFLDSQITSITNERVYWIVGLLVLFIIMLFMLGHQMGIFDRIRERAQQLKR